MTAAARQLLVSPVDRAWPRGLPDAVLELAQNPTHDWLFSHKANSQTRGLSTTLLAIVPPLTPRESERCISALLHNSVTHILNLHHLVFSFTCITSKHLMQEDRQRTFHIRHSSYFFLLPTLIATQRVPHCPFSNNVSYALTAGLLCARKVLPIQGFPFCTTRLFLRHTSLLHNRQGPALTCRAGSATPRHVLKTSLIKKGLPKGDYKIQIFFLKCQFAVTTFFFTHAQ